MCFYAVPESDLAFTDYVARLKVDPEGSGSRVTWSSQFGIDGDGNVARTTEATLRNIYARGLRSIADHFSGG